MGIGLIYWRGVRVRDEFKFKEVRIKQKKTYIYRGVHMVWVQFRIRVWVSRRKCDCHEANVKLSRVINLGFITVACANDNSMCPCLGRYCSGMPHGSLIWIDK